jgi:anti-sigma28 factor (negative regulator of flagellin synthesis)
MRIDDLNRAPLTQEPGKTEHTADARALEKDSKAARGTDLAEVSQMAQALSTGDPRRLEQLRLAVQSGKYEVPAEAVAKAIIDHHSTLTTPTNVTAPPTK